MGNETAESLDYRMAKEVEKKMLPLVRAVVFFDIVGGLFLVTFAALGGICWHGAYQATSVTAKTEETLTGLTYLALCVLLFVAITHSAFDILIDGTDEPYIDCVEAKRRYRQLQKALTTIVALDALAAAAFWALWHVPW